MKVYHGTNEHFDTIDLAKCSPDNDFGQGFYLTAIRQHAEQRAQNKADRYGGEAVVMEFEFDEKYLTDKNYRTLLFDTPTREWVEFVMQNRNRTLKTDSLFDIVAGPIADDKMRRQFDRYETKEITMQQLLGKITFREPTHQIMLGSEAAVALIQPNENTVTLKEDIITAVSIALVRDTGWDMIEAMNKIYNSDVFNRLENEKLYRKSWIEIYEMLKRELMLKK